MQSLGKIALRAPAVGAKMWCLFLFVCHSPSPEHRAFDGCISNKDCVAVYCPISRFSAFFPQDIPLSDTLHSSHIHC